MSKRLRDEITLDSVLDEIEQIRQMALAENDYKTALNCTMSKCKLMGGGRSLEQRERHNSDPVKVQLFGEY